MALPYKIISVDVSTLGVSGSYIDSHGDCQSIPFKKGLYSKGSRYTTNGKRIVENTDVKISSIPSNSLNMLKFAIKLFNILNPLCDHKLYSSGGIVKYGEKVFLLCGTPVNGVVKAYNFTYNVMCKLEIIDNGYYIHPHIAKVYLVSWNIFSSLGIYDLEPHPITQFTLSKQNIFNLIGAKDANMSIMSIFEMLNGMPGDIKEKALRALNLFTTGDTDGALNMLTVFISDGSITSIIKSQLIAFKTALTIFDIGGGNPTEISSILDFQEELEQQQISLSKLESSSHEEKEEKSDKIKLTRDLRRVGSVKRNLTQTKSKSKNDYHAKARTELKKYMSGVLRSRPINKSK